MDKKDMSRIIGDFLEINADIIQQRESSKLPKFIANIRASYHHKKLIKAVNKFKKSKYILTKDNLAEFFAYTYNNFPPYGSYKSVLASKINDKNANEIEGIIKFDSYKAVITIDKRYKKFDISIYNKVSQISSQSCSINVEKLYSEKEVSSELLSKINEKILEDMCDYILSIIMIYYDKEK